MIRLVDRYGQVRDGVPEAVAVLPADVEGGGIAGVDEAEGLAGRELAYTEDGEGVAFAVEEVEKLALFRALSHVA